MERTGDCQPLAPHTGRFHEEFQRVDAAGRTANNCLLGCILGTPPDSSGQGGKHRLDRRPIGLQRQHRAISRAQPLDRVSPSPRCRRTRLLRPAASSSECRKLTEAVAGNDVGPEAQRPENLPGEQITEVHRPLGLPDAGSELVWLAPGHLSQPRLPAAICKLIEVGQGCTPLRSLLGDALQHSGVLGTLAREEGGNLHRVS